MNRRAWSTITTAAFLVLTFLSAMALMFGSLFGEWSR